MRKYNSEEVKTRIWAKIQRLGTQAAYAHLVGLSAGQLSHVLAGRKPPSKAILDDLGMKAVTYYEQKE